MEPRPVIAVRPPAADARPASDPKALRPSHRPDTGRLTPIVSKEKCRHERGAQPLAFMT